MSTQSVLIHTGAPEETYSVASTDVAAALASTKLYLDGIDHSSDPDGSIKRATSVHITTEDESIRIGFKSTPTTSLGHLYPALSIINLGSWAEITAFKFISAAAGVHANLQVTVYF